MSNINYALAYAEHGLNVFPVWSINDEGTCTCGNLTCSRKGKHPIGNCAPNGSKSATQDEALIKQWFSQYPKANIGIALEGITVIDIDPRNGGNYTAESIQPFLQQTLTARTGGGGNHYFFEGQYNNISGKKGIDIKHGRGMYVVVEPSNHHSGGKYQFLDWDVLTESLPKLNPLPPELIAFFCHNKAINILESIVVDQGLGFDNLPPFTQQLIRGDGWDKYPSRSEMVFGVLKDCIRAGLTDQTITSICCNSQYALLPVIKKHRGIGWINIQLEKARVQVEQEHGNDLEEIPLVNDFPQFPDNGFYGIAGEVAKLGSEKNEADPVAVYVSFLVAMAAMIGDSTYLQIGDSKHFARIFSALVGASSRSRKGTSFKPVERIIREVEKVFDTIHKPVLKKTLNITNGGLSTAEGLIYEVRDEAEETQGKDNIPLWCAVDDKRLLVVEEELAQVFKVAKREGNTLTPLLRKAWDGGILSPMTKNNRLKSTNPHINVLGHITHYELKSLLTKDDVFNGLANRFLWVCVRRQKQVPFPEPMDSDKVSNIATRLANILRRLTDRAATDSEIKLSEDAKNYWTVQYSSITLDRHGAIGAITARDEAHALRFAILFALLDDETEIAIKHLQAAITVVEYNVKSAKFIFTTPQDKSPDAQKLLTALEDKDLTQTEISNLFNRNKNRQELSALLNELQAINRIRRISKDGDTKTIWSRV